MASSSRPGDRDKPAKTPEEIEADEAATVQHWRTMLGVLKTEDWDRRVRISSGTHDGARVGSVATVPAIGVKLALRKAMIEQAQAEIRASELAAELRELRLKRALAAWAWIALGGVVVGGAAALLRFGLGG